MDWNKEKLIEKYMDDPDTVSIAAGVMLAPPKGAPTPSRQSSLGGGLNPLKRLTRRGTTELTSPTRRAR